MKRAIALLAGLFLAAFDGACCITYADLPMSLTSETALLVWDEENKIEHFVRGAEFDGKAPDFGFILPVPEQPFAIEVANPELFTHLLQQEPVDPNARPMDAAKADAGGVNVLDEKVVGDYKATVFEGSDGRSLNDWLGRNGYKTRPAMTPWLDYYAKKHYIFVAFKYQGQKGATPTRAVRVSFPAEAPHYPYKMPTDTWTLPHARQLDLFVLSQRELRGQLIDGKPWGKALWTAEVDGPPIGKLMTERAKTAQVKLPAKMVLTRFSSGGEENEFDVDLTFVPAPPKLLYALVGVLFLAGIAATLLLMKYRRKAAEDQDEDDL